jgi:hypothetical protein
MSSEQNKKRGVFALSAERTDQVLKLGLDEILTFLVVSSGSDASNAKSKWSGCAVRKYLGVGTARAEAAINRLTEAGIWQRKVYTRKRGSLYRFPVSRGEEKIWLPTALVTGLVSDVVSPIRRLREADSVEAARLLLQMYRRTNLVEHGGLARADLRRDYPALERLCERGEYTIWSLPDGAKAETAGRDFYAPFLLGRPIKKADGTTRDAGMENFWTGRRILEEMGLIEFVPHIADNDADQSVVIHPYPLADSAGEDWEREVAGAAHTTAYAMLPPEYQEIADMRDLTLLPTYRHLRHVAVVGIARPVYRQHTSMAALWVARSRTGAEQTVATYAQTRSKFDSLGACHGAKSNFFEAKNEV